MDTKLIAMHTLTINDLSTAICTQLMFLALAIYHKELVVLYIGCGARFRIPVVSCLSRNAILPYDLFCLEVYKDESLSIAYRYDGLIGIGECGVHQVAHIFHIIAPCPSVDIIKGEEQVFLSCLGIDEVAFFHIGIHQFLSPPGEIHVLRLHLVVVVAAKVQVFQREKFILCTHRSDRSE